MAITGLSEFTFGFGFLFEQTRRNWAGLSAVPILPSLQQEALLGWDARLPLNGVDHYYQFKLSDYLFRRNANLRKDRTFNDPYYRFSLHKADNNRQHNLLKWFAEDFPETYYVAPEFNNWDHFNLAFLNGRVVQSSRLIALMDCDYHDDDLQHIIAFQPGSTSWEERSEPKHHESSYNGENVDLLWLKASNSREPINQAFAESVWQTQRDRAISFAKEFGRRRTRASVPEELLRPPPQRTRTGYLERAGEIVRTVFGSVMVILGSSKDIRG